MLQVQAITKKLKDFRLVLDLYYSAFPSSEQAPIFFLLQRAKKDNIKFSAYYDEDIFVGFSYTITFGDLTYLLYLAVRQDIRSKGYGAQILKHIREFYPENRIILNIEIEDATAENNAERIRRKSFYIRNGYSLAGFSLEMSGNMFEFLISGGVCIADEFRELFKKYMGSLLFAFYKPKIIKY